MDSLDLLHVHTTTHPGEKEQGLEVVMEDMCVDDATVDDMTQSRDYPQPTSSDGLLGVSNGNGPDVIQRPASAPPVFPQTGPDLDRHDVEVEVSLDGINDLCDDRVGYVHCLRHVHHVVPQEPVWPVCLAHPITFLLPPCSSNLIGLCRPFRNAHSFTRCMALRCGRAARIRLLIPT